MSFSAKSKKTSVKITLQIKFKRRDYGKDS